MSAALQQLDILTAAPLPPEPVVRRPVRAHMRRVRGGTPLSGAERKDAALARHEEREAVRLARDYVRVQLLELYRSRAVTAPKKASVSADDADVILRAWPECPRAIYDLKSQAWRGTIFAGGAWERTGERIVSTRPGMHAHDYPTWRPTT